MMAENRVLFNGPYFLSDITANFKLITMHNKWDLFLFLVFNNEITLCCDQDFQSAE
jgi:hypothetical protein